MSLSKSTALSLAGQKDLALEPEHSLQKMPSQNLTITHEKHDSGRKEKNILNNKDSP
jgi:hypothetical protein